MSEQTSSEQSDSRPFYMHAVVDEQRMLTETGETSLTPPELLDWAARAIKGAVHMRCDRIEVFIRMGGSRS